LGGNSWEFELEMKKTKSQKSRYTPSPSWPIFPRLREGKNVMFPIGEISSTPDNVPFPSKNPEAADTQFAEKWTPPSTQYTTRRLAHNVQPLHPELATAEVEGPHSRGSLQQPRAHRFEKVSLAMNIGRKAHIWRISAMQWRLGGPLACFQPG
jgi:hypothetical protein